MRSAVFCLLLLLSPAGDALALSTPERDDDVAAAEDDDYLPRVGPDRDEQPRASSTPGASAAPDLHSPCLNASLRARAARRCAHARPDPLYALMSMQC